MNPLEAAVSQRPALFLLLLCCAPARAQTTPPDSIHALRVDPASYPGQDYVLLLEDGVVRIEADGRSTYRLRQVAQILTPEGADLWGELSLWHTPARQRVTIEWARVIGPDGTVVQDGPAHVQETAPPVEPGVPVYSDRRARQATLGGVAPGSIVDYSYTVQTYRPWLAGDFHFGWNVNGWAPVRRSRFTLDAPSDSVVRVVERNVPAATESVADGRRRRTWTAAEVPGFRSEPYAGTPNDVAMSIAVYGRLSWDRIAVWYDSLRGAPDELPADLLAEHAAQLRGAATLEDSLRRTQRWVAQDFRYVSLALGEGGYRPRPPAEVFRTRFGDCKDKAMLFVRLARRLGVEAHPVLVHSDGDVDSLYPSLQQFDHMIAVVRRAGRIEYVDLTESLAPYGELSEELQGAVGLALTDAGPRIVVPPESAPEANRYDEEVVGSLERDGRFVGRVTLSAAGTEQYRLRSDLADLREQDSTARDDELRRYAKRVYSTALVDSARYTDGRDLGIPPRLIVWFSAANVVSRVADDRYYFNLPISSFGSETRLSQVEADQERRFPIDIAQVNAPSVYRLAFEFQLPDGWKADVPSPVTVNGPFGYYRAEYRQAGRTLRASREMGGGRGLLPPDSVGALRAWLRGVAGDRVSMIVLERGTGPALLADGGGDGSGGTGTLPDVLLTAADLTGAQVAREGVPEETGQMLQSLASTTPLATFQRDFAATQVVFTHGESRMAALQVAAATFRSAAEARRPVEFLDLFDLRALLEGYLRGEDQDQMSLGAARAIPLDSIGDRARGWVVELVTPLATFEMAMLMAARGRVSLTLVAVGPQGLREADLAHLLRTEDERVRGHPAYLADLSGSAADSMLQLDYTAIDSALTAATSVRLDSLVGAPKVPDPLTTTAAVFRRSSGWPTYHRSIHGRALTFPLRGKPTYSADLTVTLHETEAQALKEVLAAERAKPARLLRSLLNLGELNSLLESVVTDSTGIERVAGPAVGARSVTLLARVREVFRTDVTVVVFARGRVSGRVTVMQAAGEGDPAGADSLAREVERRVRAIGLAPDEAPPRAALVDAVRRVADAEAVVDSLVDARAFDAAFRAIERARLARAPVGFSAGTWNGVCWWGSLYGHARRALAACDAAVAPDTTDLSIRDSRGLARALAGDLPRARDDFEYVVKRAPAGTFLDIRAKWLEALRAGNSPFTEEVLNELKGS
jgi:hypothetical protein